MAFTLATLDYLVNPTGPRTAAQLAASMQAAALAIITPNLLSLLGCALVSAVGSVVGAQARLRIIYDISSATFQARWPSVESGNDFGPFSEEFTGDLRAAINQPVLASDPAFS